MGRTLRREPISVGSVPVNSLPGTPNSVSSVSRPSSVGIVPVRLSPLWKTEVVIVGRVVGSVTPLALPTPPFDLPSGSASVANAARVNLPPRFLSSKERILLRTRRPDLRLRCTVLVVCLTVCTASTVSRPTPAGAYTSTWQVPTSVSPILSSVSCPR